MNSYRRYVFEKAIEKNARIHMVGVIVCCPRVLFNEIYDYNASENKEQFSKNKANYMYKNHAFAIKTLLYLFDCKNIDKDTQIANASVIKLLYDGKKLKRE